MLFLGILLCVNKNWMPILILSPWLTTSPKNVLQIIKDNWDSLWEVRAVRPMLNFEFWIDTENKKAICCHQPKYRVYEAKIVSKQISYLENCTGLLGTLLLLTAKPHQKFCTNIDKFIWRLCVSYRTLNGVTRSFEFSLPHCSDSIKNLGDSNGKLYFISLDTRSSYHQIRVRECGQEKLDFFTSEGEINVLLLFLLNLKMRLILYGHDEDPSW